LTFSPEYFTFLFHISWQPVKKHPIQSIQRTNKQVGDNKTTGKLIRSKQNFQEKNKHKPRVLSIDSAAADAAASDFNPNDSNSALRGPSSRVNVGGTK
jgi:hypothetical protein